VFCLAWNFYVTVVKVINIDLRRDRPTTPEASEYLNFRGKSLVGITFLNRRKIKKNTP
jgi:hypothetical protein